MGKVWYGALFVVVLPLALIAWARATDNAVHLETPRWPAVGWTLTALGLGLMVEAMRLLWVRGGGLPMNAYPPQRLVSEGVYRVVPHPIYVGCVMVCMGVSLAWGSASGVWLVTPTVAMGCAALVVGYEGPALRRRFGGRTAEAWLRPPAGEASVPTVRDRVSVYLLLFLPWLVAYEGWGHAQPAGLSTPELPGEAAWVTVPWTAWIYIAAYPLAMGVPLGTTRGKDLRRFFDAGLVALAVMTMAYVSLPLRSPVRPVDAGTAGGWLLAMERADGLGGAVACPSYHAVWSMLAACAWSRRGAVWAWLAWALALSVCVSCVTTGMHRVVDVIAAVPVVMLAWRWGAVWAAVLRVSERVANSWSSVRLGPVRVINYAAYAGLSAGVGLFIAACLAGEGRAGVLSVVAIVALVGAGVWGQLMVGSPTLLRPFGYFGSVLGAGGALGVVALTRGAEECWRLVGALAVSAPWIVIIGRVRCLVQGCCHGGPIGTGDGGIRYVHPMSRACRIAHLDGVPVHPTPVYSMLSNVMIGVLVARLWAVEAPLTLIGGVYLLLAGLARFVEESRRGEPQTQIVGGLRIYQWLATGSVVVGGVLTAVESPAASGAWTTTWSAAGWAAAVGVVYALAMGVDVPESNRRFSRLV